MGLVVWLLARERKALSAIAASIPSYAIEKRKVDLARKEDAQPAIEKIAKAYANQQVDLRDGAWVNFTTGELAGKVWLHVRASNTEPIMRLIAEAPTVAAARGVLDEAGRVIG
jgi:phosphomannomutase